MTSTPSNNHVPLAPLAHSHADIAPATSLTEMLFALLSLRDASSDNSITDLLQTVAWLLPSALGESCTACRIVWMNTTYEAPGVPFASPDITVPFDSMARAAGRIEIWRTVRGPLTPITRALLDDCANSIGASLHQLSILNSTRQRADQYRATFDLVSEALFLYSVDGVLLDINNAGMRMIGAEQDSLRGTSFAELLSPDLAQQLGEHIENSRHAATDFYEAHLRHRTGQLIPVEMVDRRLILQDREAVLTIARDISERRAHMQKIDFRIQRERLIGELAIALANAAPNDEPRVLAHVLERLGSAFAAQRAFIIQFDTSHAQVTTVREWCTPGTPACWNAFRGAACNSLPWNMALIAKSQNIIIHDAETLDDAFRRERERHTILGIAASLVVPLHQGRTLVGIVGIDNNSTPRQWNDDDRTLLETVACVIGSTTGNIAANRRQQRAHEHLSAVLDALPSQVAVVDEKGFIVSTNASWAHYTKDATLPTPMRCIIGDHYLNALGAHGRNNPEARQVAACLRDILAKQCGATSFEYQVEGPECRTFLLQLAPIGNPFRGAVIARSEITRQRQKTAPANTAADVLAGTQPNAMPDAMPNALAGTQPDAMPKARPDALADAPADRWTGSTPPNRGDAKSPPAPEGI